MDFACIEAFVAVARHGSFTAAARVLHVSQPGVTRQVQRFERDLGVSLLERGGSCCRLTPAGQTVLPWAEEMLARRQSLLSRLHGAASSLAGALRITASTTPGEFLVPELVAGFVREHPAVQPMVAIVDSAVVAQSVRAHTCDLGFAGARLQSNGLRYRTVLEDEVVLAVPASHPFAARGEIDLSDLQGQPFLEREGGSGTAATVARALAERGLTLPPVQTVMTLGTSTAIVSAAERGLGIGWVSSLALTGRGRDRVVAVRLHGLPVRRVLSLVDDPRRTLPPVAGAFVSWVESWQEAREAASGGDLLRSGSGAALDR